MYAPLVLLGLLSSAIASPATPPSTNISTEILTSLQEYGVEVQKLSTSIAKYGLTCGAACDALNVIYGGQTNFPNSTQYETTRNSYFAEEQSDHYPACYYQPSNANEVSAAVLISRATNCQFAVKSGGHAAAPGASNIQDGVTINLANINQTVLSGDRKIASVGPGSTWAPVYETLQKTNTSVIGGRVGNVGVGGLLLGGGVSYLSGVHGWACDNIANFEVVLASGKQVSANLTSNPDLYKALRGGGNNFGIITRFDLYAFNQGNIYGATLAYSANETSAALDAFVNFTEASNTDFKGSLEMDFTAIGGVLAIGADIRYADPIDKPELLQPFFKVPGGRTIRSEINTQSQFTLYTESAIPDMEYVLDFSGTFMLDKEFLLDMIAVFVNETKSTYNLTGAYPGIQLHPLTTNILGHMSDHGGNVLGLNATQGNMYFIHLAGLWNNPAHTEPMTTAMTNAFNAINAKAVEKGKLHPYQYMNYANIVQDPIGSYGADNVNFMKTVSKKYDPMGVFQKLAPGYFKL